MGLSGYTSLSLEEKRYAKLRKNWESKVVTENSFTVWATEVLEHAIEREDNLANKFKHLTFVGSTNDGGCVIQDRSEIIQIKQVGGTYSCSKDKGICNHILFAALNPRF